jgi:hypothetical protein
MGFTFDDTDNSGTANPISELERLTARDDRNRERIFPYLGGEEFLNHPAQSWHRYVIDFADLSLEDAGDWPDLLAIVENKVKPFRDIQNRESNRERWWQFGEKRPALRRELQAVDRQIVFPFVGKYHATAFVPSQVRVAGPANVIASDSFAMFAVLQSRVHETWARFLSSSLKDDVRYIASDCFETFPFVTNWQSNVTLLNGGREYYDFRATLMVKNNEGLTKTYNRFHDPDERDPDILRLRDLHDAMDRVVLDAYGWTDIQPTCDFILDYEEDDDEQPGKASRKKKPWRYRWQDDVRDEVLGRLLELNARRAEEEKVAGAAAAAGGKGSPGKVKGAKKQAKPKGTPLLD